jgi:NADPH:quinone reductase-like Zn-dependent oxidoreductase
MQAVVLPRHGPPEVLLVEERADPQAAAGQVRIRVEAAGLNFSDLLARVGIYPDAPKVPSVLGYEVAGVVDNVGSGVDGIRPGDRVVAATRFGGFAELVVANAADMLILPESMSTVDAAAIPVNYGTAYAALFVMGGVRGGDRVLIHSAGGGVGIAATQLARHLGAMVIGVGSAAKHERMRKEGADHVVDYRSQDVATEVLRITDGEGVDIILDPIGPTSLRQDWKVLRPGGRVIAYGVSQVQTGEKRNMMAAMRMLLAFPFATMPWWQSAGMMNQNKGVFGLNVLHWWDQEGGLARLLTPIRELIDTGVVRPVVDSTFTFDQAADAHRRLMSGETIGKVVLTPGHN